MSECPIVAKNLNFKVLLQIHGEHFDILMLNEILLMILKSVSYLLTH